MSGDGDNRARRHRRAFLALAALLGAIAAFVALPLVPASRSSVGPGTIAARAHPGTGATVFQIPPLGTVEAETHLLPLTLKLSLAEIDLATLAEAVATDAARDELAGDLEADLRAMGRRVAIRIVLAGIVVGAIAAALLMGRHLRYMAPGAAGGGVAMALLMLGVGATLDVESFQEPRFTGALVKAPVVLEAVRRGEITAREVRSRYETAADRLAELLALVARPNRDPREDTVAILHISDIHSNPLGLEIAEQLATEFDVDAILDSGDVTNFGLAFEANIGRLIERIDRPYYFVPGNHDSAVVVAALAGLSNVTVLDRRMVDVEGIDILGWDDPTYTNWNEIPVEEANRIRVEEGDEVLGRVRRLEPDVLAVHDRRIAQASYGRVPLVLAGHDHERVLEVVEETDVLAVGSTGATGFKFFVEGERDYEAEIVYFRGSAPVAVDYVRFSGLGSDFEVERTTLGGDEPEPPDQATPGA